jgi:7,8-dihydro-6-hydroxymethylpterin-pyrophosphokinase
VDFKRTPIRGESTIRFIQVDDLDLEGELQQLIAAASSEDLKRRQRDEGWGPKTIDLVLDYEKTSWSVD